LFLGPGRVLFVAKNRVESGGKTIVSKTGVREVTKEMRKKYGDRPKIAFFAQDWEDGYNVGGLFRLADGCGASEIILTGKSPKPEENPMIAVTSMGQHRRVSWRHFDRHDDACMALIEEGWTLVAVEVADGAVDVSEYEFPAKTCLVLGNEGGGVYGNVIKKCAAAVFIPMFGKGRSFNVTSAAGIVAYAAVFGSKGYNENVKME
jgi:23S rRNA (guanosine2251-2'-O)-methyltransferase